MLNETKRGRGGGGGRERERERETQREIERAYLLTVRESDRVKET